MGDSSWRAPVLEVHLLDGCNINEEESESSLKVEFVRFLRPERRFGSSAALSRQIAADVRAARLTL
jgi:FAD synthase